MELSQTYIRLPKTVIAHQWFPSKKLNYVEEIMGEVVQASAQSYMGVSYDPTSPYQPPRDKKLMVIGGKVRIGEKVVELEPSDYVIYDHDSGLPIQVLNERTFISAYVTSSRFTLCETCDKAAKIAVNPKIPQTVEEAIAMLQRGEVISFEGSDKSIKTVEELKMWMAKGRK